MRFFQGLIGSNPYQSITLLLVLGTIPIFADIQSVAAGRIPMGIAQTATSTIIYVNSETGNDLQGNGTAPAPLRTISKAIKLAPANTSTVIQLTKGTYSTATGEAFPIALKAGISIVGNEISKGNGIKILGGGNYTSPTLGNQNVTIIGVNQSEIRGVTVTNPSGSGLWLESTSPMIANNTISSNAQDGAIATGNSQATIFKNIFVVNKNRGLSVQGTSRPDVRDNIFQSTGIGIHISQNAIPKITNNRIAGNTDGILSEDESQPILRGNVIEKSQRDGLAIAGQSLPNLGNASDAGNNRFSNNTRYDISSANPNIVISAGNETLPQKISGKVQLIAATRTAPTQLQPVSQSPTPAQTFTNTATPSVNKPITLLLPKQTPQTPLSSIAPAIATPSQANLAPSTRPIPVPNSVIVQISPQQFAEPIPANTSIAASLPPIRSYPPAGEPVNRPIVIAPKSFIRPNAESPRYRVVVPIVSASSTNAVRRIVPNAFPSNLNGQPVVQIGAYSDRAIANAQVKKLQRAGFNATIERINR